MAVYLKDLLARPELLDRAPERKTCQVCGVPLQETITGKRKVPKGHACSDCFYAEIGAEIEAHPVATGSLRRG